MTRFQSVSVLLSILCCLVIVNADLTILGKNCGARKCTPLEYCSEFTSTCQSCADVCTQKHHNFDESRCTKDCQNYLHDIRYLNNNKPQDESDLRAEVRNLHYMVSVTLTLTCLILVFLSVVFIIKTCRWKKKHEVTISWLRKKLKLKEASKSEKPANTVAVTANSGRPDLRLDMPPIGLQTPSGNGNTPSTATTTLSRRPTEDNTLDYAYDNPVMVSTPSPNPKPHESSL